MAQKLHVLDLKLEGSSRNHKTVCCYRTWGRAGEGQDRNYMRNVGQACSSQLPVQLLPLYPDQCRRMAPWKTDGHEGPQEAPGSGEYKRCHALNETVNLLNFRLNG